MGHGRRESPSAEVCPVPLTSPRDPPSLLGYHSEPETKGPPRGTSRGPWRSARFDRHRPLTLTASRGLARGRHHLRQHEGRLEIFRSFRLLGLLPGTQKPDGEVEIKQGQGEGAERQPPLAPGWVNGAERGRQSLVPPDCRGWAQLPAGHPARPDRWTDPTARTSYTGRSNNLQELAANRCPGTQIQATPQRR